MLFIAVIYLIDTAASLPAFFPGHEAGSSHQNVKHTNAFFLLGAAALFGAWFTTNPETDDKKPSEPRT